MKVTLSVVEGELEVSSINDFKLVLGKGTALTLEIKDADFILRECVTMEQPKLPKKKAGKVLPHKRKLRIVK
jgi:hypothetical protein